METFMSEIPSILIGILAFSIFPISILAVAHIEDIIEYEKERIPKFLSPNIVFRVIAIFIGLLSAMICLRILYTLPIPG